MFGFLLFSLIPTLSSSACNKALQINHTAIQMPTKSQRKKTTNFCLSLEASTISRMTSAVRATAMTWRPRPFPMTTAVATWQLRTSKLLACLAMLLLLFLEDQEVEYWLLCTVKWNRLTLHPRQVLANILHEHGKHVRSYNKKQRLAKTCKNLPHDCISNCRKILGLAFSYKILGKNVDIRSLNDLTTAPTMRVGGFKL